MYKGSLYQVGSLHVECTDYNGNNTFSMSKIDIFASNNDRMSIFNVKK